jgi:O-antigen/teichoic acid export membrane protein
MENTSKKKVLKNAVISVIQVIVTSITLFMLYRLLISTIGIARLGVWSAVLATTSVANIANFGLSGSVVKYIAKYIATGDEKKVTGVIETAAISIGL